MAGRGLGRSPETPMKTVTGAVVPAAAESRCQRRACVRARETVALLNSQVDTLTSTLKELSRRFRIMQRRSHRRPSDFRRQAKQLLSSFTIEEDIAEEAAVPPSPRQQADPEPGPSPEHSSSQASCSKSPATSGEHGLPQFPDHVAVGEDPKNHGDSGDHNQPLFKKHRPVCGLCGRNTPPTCRLSKRVLFSIRREVRMMLQCMKRPVTMHQMTVKRAKDGQLIPKALLEKCREEARKTIPKILGKSMSSVARNNGSVEDRTKLSRFMCHDTRTADKFYACNLKTKEAWEHRQLFQKVLEGPDVLDEPIAKVGKRPCKRKRSDNASPLTSQTTSEDEAEPVYQESGVSSLESEENSSDGDPSEARSSVYKRLRRAAIVLTPLKMRRPPAESPNKLEKEYPSRA
ncbi:hypothetical protein E1301_Tti020727 [Triplophysa tibetana]|uniref:Uncharacterized protein n=1 Tax=Triplophysa tibetana TaxID=1572043 RepID=A0A5A9NDP8_9TELE|nr:hypothetical protein E1301_Tti020727 [Triplophysa tibetana]